MPPHGEHSIGRGRGAGLRRRSGGPRDRPRQPLRPPVGDRRHPGLGRGARSSTGAPPGPASSSARSGPIARRRRRATASPPYGRPTGRRGTASCSRSFHANPRHGAKSPVERDAAARRSLSGGRSTVHPPELNRSPDSRVDVEQLHLGRLARLRDELRSRDLRGGTVLRSHEQSVTRRAPATCRCTPCTTRVGMRSSPTEGPVVDVRLQGMRPPLRGVPGRRRGARRHLLVSLRDRPACRSARSSSGRRASPSCSPRWAAGTAASRSTGSTRPAWPRSPGARSRSSTARRRPAWRG